MSVGSLSYFVLMFIMHISLSYVIRHGEGGGGGGGVKEVWG